MAEPETGRELEPTGELSLEARVWAEDAIDRVFEVDVEKALPLVGNLVQRLETAGLGRSQDVVGTLLVL